MAVTGEQHGRAAARGQQSTGRGLGAVGKEERTGYKPVGSCLFGGTALNEEEGRQRAQRWEGSKNYPRGT